MKKTIIAAAINAAAVALLVAGCGKTSAPDQPPVPMQASTRPNAAAPPAALTVATSVVSPQSAQQMTPPDALRTEPPQPYASAPMEPVEELPQVVSVYVDFPDEQPAPVLVDWTPPPMLVDAPPPSSYDDAVWTGGYWVWEGGWVWAHGRWTRPPHYGYRWHNPYYEHRNDGVVFINGFWCAPNVAFVAPSRNHTPRGAIVAGLGVGRRPEGPLGVFVPPPPGSHYGLLVPAPLNTPPAVVVGAPPMVRNGMRIVAGNSVGVAANTSNVIVVAPANTTTAGHPLTISAPTLPHLAAAQRPLVIINAPEADPHPIPAYQTGRASLLLPPPQSVQLRNAPNARQEQQVAVAPIAPAAQPVSAQVLTGPPALQVPQAPVAPAPQYQALQPQQRQVLPANLPPQQFRPVTREVKIEEKDKR